MLGILHHILRVFLHAQNLARYANIILLTVCPPVDRECAEPKNPGFRRLVIHFKGIPKPYQHTENLGILRSLSRDIGQKPKISDFGLFT